MKMGKILWMKITTHLSSPLMKLTHLQKTLQKSLEFYKSKHLKAIIIHFHSLLSTLEKHIVVGGTCGNMHARHHPRNKSPLNNQT